ncbi:hypothetical protein MBLNU459_g5039t1 [Dothideomycetes sp. NU459]
MAQKTIYRSPFPDYFVPTNTSAHQFLLDFNPDDVLPDKIIYEDLAGDRKTMTYGDLRVKAAMAAAGLKKKYNLKAGDTVVVLAQNSVDYALLAHSVMWFGGVIVGINYMASTFELGHYLSIAGAKLIVAGPAHCGRIKEAISASNGALKSPTVIELGGTSSTSFPSSVLNIAEPIAPLDLSGVDNRKVPAAVVFSSGTSGKPKGVQWSHHNVIAQMLSSRTGNPEATNSSAREVFFAPFAHTFGLLGAMLVPSFVGSYIAIMHQFEYGRWIQACADIKATTMKMVPAIAVAISKDENLERLDLQSVNTIMSAGATLQAEVVKRLQHLLRGVSITQGYGMSEVAVSTLRAGRSLDKAGSVGRLFPNLFLRVVDEDLNDVPIGTTGEALVKGPTVFMSYRGDPKATAEQFHDGWLRTGDSLQIDQDGFLWFKDRKKEMIKYKGNQVAPAELEDVLNSHEDVLEAAVCAKWDESGQTEIPIGYVVLKPSIPVSEREAVLERILKWTDGLFARYKKIRGGLHYIEAIPKNPTGKVMRSMLPARLEAVKIEAERQAKTASRSAKL